DHSENFARRGLLLQRFLELVEQSAVLNGDDSLIGKRFEQLDLRRSKRTNLHATRGQYSNELFLLTKRSGQVSVISDAGTHGWEIVLLLGVANVKRAMLAYPVNVWLINTDFDAANWYGTKMSPSNHHVSVKEAQHHVINPANFGGALDNRIEYRLHVGGRAADDAEHFGSRCLVLQRLAQFCIALLQFLEQPHVLDSDDGLSRESFKQFDL